MSYPRQDEFFRIGERPDGTVVVELPDIANVHAGQFVTIKALRYQVQEVTTDYGPREWAPRWWVNQVQRIVLKPAVPLLDLADGEAGHPDQARQIYESTAKG